MCSQCAQLATTHTYWYVTHSVVFCNAIYYKCSKKERKSGKAFILLFLFLMHGNIHILYSFFALIQRSVAISIRLWMLSEQERLLTHRLSIDLWQNTDVCCPSTAASRLIIIQLLFKLWCCGFFVRTRLNLVWNIRSNLSFKKHNLHRNRFNGHFDEWQSERWMNVEKAKITHCYYTVSF